MADAVNEEVRIKNLNALTKLKNLIAGSFFVVDGVSGNCTDNNGDPIIANDSTVKISAEVLLNIVNDITAPFDPDVPYVVGKTYYDENGKLYECVTAHSGAWNPDHFEETSVENVFAKARELAALTTYAQNVAQSIAPEYNGTTGAVSGKLYMHEGSLYLCKENTSGDWVGTKFMQVNADEVFARLKNFLEVSTILFEVFPAVEITETDSGYYNNSGSHVVSPAYSCSKYEVSGSTDYAVYASMFGQMAVCEFDSSDNFIISHKKNPGGSTHYESISFRTSPNTAYIWVSTDPAFIAAPKVVQDISKTLAYSDFVDLSSSNSAFRISDTPLDTADGFYKADGTFTANSDYKAIKIKVEPLTQYTFVGTMIAPIGIPYYNSVNGLCGYKSVSGTVNKVTFTTSEQADYIWISTKKTNDIQSPIVFKNTYDKDYWKDFLNPDVHEIAASSVAQGWYNRSGVLQNAAGYINKKFNVSFGHKYRAIGYMFGNLAVCEFDSNNVFIREHHRKVYEPYGQYYYSIDFCVEPNCAYVIVSSQGSSGGGKDARLYELGWNRVPCPSKFYGAAGIQKNIYHDRFGLVGYGIVNTLPNPNQDDSDCTRMHNRLELNITTAKTLPVKIYPSVCGENVWGNAINSFKDASIEFVARQNPSTAKNILWIGDSISDYQNTAKFVDACFNEVEGGVVPTFIGSRHLTGTPDEAYGGKTLDWFMTNSESPFVINGNLDFSAYNTAKGITGIDACVVELGYNDATGVAQGTLSILNYITECESFVTQFMASNPNAKIIWVLPPIESKLEKRRDYAAFTDAIMKLRHVGLYLEAKFSSVIVSDAMYCIDSVNGYPLEEVPIASVYSSLNKTQEYCSDSTHPTELGCKEWALSVYPVLIKVLTA